MSGDRLKISELIKYMEEASDALSPASPLAGCMEQFIPNSRRWLNVRRYAPVSLHLAILREPWLQMILDGTKTIESRWSKNAIGPRGAGPGDIIFLKRSGGPIVAVARAKRVILYGRAGLLLGHWEVEDIRQRYGLDIGAPDPGPFWEEKRGARYATLLELEHVTPLTQEISYSQRGQSGWVEIFKRGSELGGAL